METELTITSVTNTGDVSGIICVIKKDKDNILACGLLHLVIDRSCPLYKEITEYQIKRDKHIRQSYR